MTHSEFKEIVRAIWLNLSTTPEDMSLQALNKAITEAAWKLEDLLNADE